MWTTTNVDNDIGYVYEYVDNDIGYVYEYVDNYIGYVYEYVDCDDPPTLSAVFSLCCFLIRMLGGGVGRVVSYMGNTWARCLPG